MYKPAVSKTRQWTRDFLESWAADAKVLPRSTLATQPWRIADDSSTPVYVGFATHFNTETELQPWQTSNAYARNTNSVHVEHYHNIHKCISCPLFTQQQHLQDMRFHAHGCPTGFPLQANNITLSNYPHRVKQWRSLCESRKSAGGGFMSIHNHHQCLRQTSLPFFQKCLTIGLERLDCELFNQLFVGP